MLRRLRMHEVGSSDMRSPAYDKISIVGYTYYWFGMEDGTHLKQGNHMHLQQSVAIHC